MGDKGGAVDSLSAVRLASLLKSAMHIDVPLKLFFEKSLDEIERILVEQRGTHEAADAVILSYPLLLQHTCTVTTNCG
jgi:hypothetical protein